MLKGYTKTCGNRSKGVFRILLTEAANVIKATISPEGTYGYQTLELKPGAKFADYAFTEDQAEYKEDGDGSSGTVVFNKTVTFKTPEMDEASQAAVQEIADQSACGLIGIVVKPNKEAFVVGFDELFENRRPLRLASTAGTTGKGLTDEVGDEITLTCTHTKKSRIFKGDIDTLVIAG